MNEIKNPLSQGVYKFQPYHRQIRRMGLDPLFYGNNWYSKGSRDSEKNNNVLIISFNPHDRGGTTIITILQ